MPGEIVTNIEVAAWVTPLVKFAASILRLAVDFVNRFGIKVSCSEPGKSGWKYVIKIGGIEVTLTGKPEDI